MQIKNIISLLVVAMIAFGCKTSESEPKQTTAQPSAATATPAPEPLLLRAEFFSHTNDDNKDHDTGVYVRVTTADGSSTLAQIDNADNSGSDATEYNDHSDHLLKLITNAGVPKSACKGFKVNVSQHTNGNDTWKFNCKVTLFFSDNTTLEKAKDGIELKNDGASTSF